MTKENPSAARDQRRFEERLARARTTLEQHQINKGESLSGLADRLGIARVCVFRLVGRTGSYSRAKEPGSFRMDSSIIETVARDTGIPMGQLFEEAANAARKRSEANGEGR